MILLLQRCTTQVPEIKIVHLSMASQSVLFHPEEHTNIFKREVFGCLSMNVLVIGKGGREHALVRRLLQCPSVQHVYVAPGNGGTAAMHGVTNLEGIEDYAELAQKAKELGIGLVVPGPDNVIVDGVEAAFKESEFSGTISALRFGTDDSVLTWL